MNEQNLARGFLKGCSIFTFREALVLSFNWTMIIGKSSGSSKICRNGSFVSFRRKQLLSDASFKIVDCFNATVFFCFQLWANYEEPKNIVVVEETERKCNYKKVCYVDGSLSFCCLSYRMSYSMVCLQVIVTETKQSLSFWAQHVDSGRQTDFSCRKARGMTFHG